MRQNQKRTVCFLFGLAACLLISGCGSRSGESLENELAYRQLGINKMEEGSYQEAVQMFQNALDQSLAVIGDLEIDICYYKAASQYKAGDVEGALNTYNALIDYDPKNGDAFYLRGTVYLAQNQPDQAKKDYDKALELDPKNGTLYNRIGENLLNAGEREAAGVILNRVLEFKGTEAADYREKGYASYLLEQYDSARTYLDKAISMEDQEAVLYLARLLEAQGETEQANQLYQSYGSEESAENSSTKSFNALGCEKMKEGEYKEALTYFQDGLKEEAPEEEQELSKNEIIALEQLQEFSQAKEKMEAYLEKYPDDQEAAREYEFLKSR